MKKLYLIFYYFNDDEDTRPITVEAANRLVAREKLAEIYQEYAARDDLVVEVYKMVPHKPNYIRTLSTIELNE